MEKSSKIYVAGHGGMVGSAIWKNLESKGYTHLVGRTRSELDLLNQQETEAFFAAERPEYVFLAAAKVGGIVANNLYRGEFIYENLTIQSHVIHNAWKYGVKKLLFLGSTCIYPGEAPQPMREDALLTSPLEYTNEPYAIAKIAGIKLCESYNLQYGTNFISVMPTNLYGPNDNFDLERSHVLPALVRKIHLGKCLEEGNLDAIRTDLSRRPVEGITGQSDEKAILDILKKYGIRDNSSLMSENSCSPFEKLCTIEIWGTGKPMREFLWSEDMADACVFLMERVNFSDLKGASGERGEVRNTHINIGTGREVSIRDLARMIADTVGFRGSLAFDATKPDGTMRKLTDPSKLHSLGWQHTVDLEEGLRLMYGHYNC
jgi:GDP-L-fucose synthase